MTTLQILHLSDTHFSGDHFYFHRDGKPDIEGFTKAVASDRSPDLVVVSGDLAWRAHRREYELAIVFIRSFRTLFPTCPVVVVPGNHDVDLDGSLRDDRRQKEFVRFLRSSFTATEVRRQYPLLGSTGRDAGLTQREQLCAVVMTPSMIVVGVNSAAYIQADGKPDASKRTPIFVGELVLRALESHLSSQSVSRTRDKRLRLFVMHHHLLPFLESPYGATYDAHTFARQPVDDSMVSNSGALQAWLSGWNFEMVVHGHKHVPHGRVDSLFAPPQMERANNIIVIGAGSAGVDSRRRSHNLSVNDLMVYRSNTATSVTVDVCEHVLTAAGPKFRSLQTYQLSTPSALLARKAFVVEADTVADAYEQIQFGTSVGMTTNAFVCRIHDPNYQHPSTAPVPEADVVLSFRTLNPQLIPTTRGRPSKDDWRLARTAPPVARQLRHGDRIFGNEGTPSRWDAAIAAYADSTRRRRAYISLFDTLEDVLTSPVCPPPGLVGLQFVPSSEGGGIVDLIATFRHLELSSWFLVNCYEAAALLSLAVRSGALERQARCGAIWLMASHATWENSPRLSLAAQLDLSPRLVRGLVRQVLSGDSTRVRATRERLGALLSEKADRCHPGNLDTGGLLSLLTEIDRLDVDIRRRLASFRDDLQRGHDGILKSMTDPLADAGEWEHGVACLRRASTAIRTVR